MLVGVAVIAAVALLAGGVVVLAKGSRGISGGAGSPTAAAQQVIDGVLSTDLVRALRALEPEEAKALVPVAETLLARVNRAGLTKDEDKPFSGVKLKLEGLQLAEESLAPDVVKVTVTGGRLIASADKGELPDAVKVAARPAEGPTATDEVDLGRLDLRDGRGRRIGPFAVATKRSGRWYVSPLLTGVEYLTLSGQLRPADHSPPPAGSSYRAGSPTEAVQKLMQAVSSTDPARVAEAMPRAEARAVKAAGGVFSTELRKLRGLRVDASNLTEEKDADGRRVVVVGRGSLDVTVPGDDGEVRVRAELDRDCVIDADDPSEPSCVPDQARRLGLDAVRLVTVNEGGQWRVSLLQTAARYLRTSLEKATDPQIQLAASSIAGPSVLTSFPPAATVPASGGAVDLSLNDAGWAVAGIDATAGQVFGISVDSDGASDEALYGPDGKHWEGPERVVIAAQPGQHKLLLRGDPGVRARVVTSPVRRLQGTLGTAVTGRGPEPVIVEITGPAGASTRSDSSGVSASVGEPQGSQWVDEGEDSSSSSSSSSSSDTFPATGKLVLTLEPYSGTTDWSYLVRKRASEFSSGGTTASGSFTGSNLTHQFTVLAGTTVNLVLTPSGWDAILGVSCRSAGSRRVDNGVTSSTESLTVTAGSVDDTCTASISSYGGTGPYSLTLR